MTLPVDSGVVAPAVVPLEVEPAAHAHSLVAAHAAAGAAATSSASPTPPATAAPQETDLPRALSTWHSAHSNATRLVESARLIERLAESEMHINLRTAELGPVELRAVMRESGLVASIGVARSEVHALLASEMPALERALGDHNFRVASLDLSDHSLGSAMSFDGRSNPDPREFSQPQTFLRRIVSQEPARVVAGAIESPAAPIRSQRLSIRA